MTDNISFSSQDLASLETLLGEMIIELYPLTFREKAKIRLNKFTQTDLFKLAKRILGFVWETLCWVVISAITGLMVLIIAINVDTWLGLGIFN